jgi:8-oxo-dGTP diphosphatase
MVTYIFQVFFSLFDFLSIVWYGIAMSREYPKRPILGVGAVVVSDDRALLVKRGKEPAKGIWSIPGGMVEIGETIHDAVRREIREETGLEIEIGDRLSILERIFRDASGRVRYHYVLVDYRAVPLGGELRAGSDAAEAGFFTPRQLEQLGLADVTAQVVVRALNGNRTYQRNISGPSGSNI